MKPDIICNGLTGHAGGIVSLELYVFFKGATKIVLNTCSKYEIRALRCEIQDWITNVHHHHLLLLLDETCKVKSSTSWLLSLSTYTVVPFDCSLSVHIHSSTIWLLSLSTYRKVPPAPFSSTTAQSTTRYVYFLFFRVWLWSSLMKKMWFICFRTSTVNNKIWAREVANKMQRYFMSITLLLLSFDTNTLKNNNEMTKDIPIPVNRNIIFALYNNVWHGAVEIAKKISNWQYFCIEVEVVHKAVYNGKQNCENKGNKKKERGIISWHKIWVINIMTIKYGVACPLR